MTEVARQRFGNRTLVIGVAADAGFFGVDVDAREPGPITVRMSQHATGRDLLDALSSFRTHADPRPASSGPSTSPRTRQ